MNKYDLLKFMETVQMEADEMAYNLVKVGQLARIQSICSFNLFWLSELSSLVCTEKTIDFLDKYSKEFKRKLTIKEFMNIDLLTSNYEYENFNQFKKAYSNFTNDPKMIMNIRIKL
jgi:hypothetical protein